MLNQSFAYCIRIFMRCYGYTWLREQNTDVSQVSFLKANMLLVVVNRGTKLLSWPGKVRFILLHLKEQIAPVKQIKSHYCTLDVACLIVCCTRPRTKIIVALEPSSINSVVKLEQHALEGVVTWKWHLVISLKKTCIRVDDSEAPGLRRWRSFAMLCSAV